MVVSAQASAALVPSLGQTRADTVAILVMAPKIPVSEAQARAALMGYKRQNYAVNPDDEKMVASYQEMRAKFARISPSQFMKYVETGQELVKAGNQSKLSFWAVPKDNFPNGLSKKMKSAEVEDADLDDAQRIDIDRDKYFVIDQCVPRDQLGKAVWVVSTYTSAQTSFQQKGPSQPTMPRTGSNQRMQPQAEDENAAPDTALALHVAGGGRRRTLRERPSDAFKDADEVSLTNDDDDSPSAKQAKIVKQTLLTLKENIEDAKKANLWVSANKLSNNSVLFWVDQTVGALEEMVKDSPSSRGQTESIVNRFTCYFIQLAQESDCYPSWVQFKGLLPRLVAAGGASMISRTCDEAKLLENLAHTDPAVPAAVNVEGASVLVRAHFYNSAIYRSYVLHMVKTALANAQKATCDADRVAALQPWANAQGLPQALSKSVDQGIHLFSSEIELSDRIKTMVSEDLCKMAIHWDATGPMGVAALLFSEAPVLATMHIPYSVFIQVCKAIDAAELMESITNPLVKSSVMLVGEFHQEPHDWVLAHTLRLRLGIVLPQDVPPPSLELINQMQKDDLLFVAQKLKSYFAKVSDLPPWLTSIQEEAKKEKDIRETAKAAKAAEAQAAAQARAAAAPAAAPAAAAPAVATAAAPAAATGASDSGDTLTQDMVVTVTWGRGDNDLNQKKAKIVGMLTHHCWVKFLEGPAKGTKKKLLKGSLKRVAQEQPQAQGSDAEPTPMKVPGELAEGAQQEDADGLSNTDIAWKSAEQVF